ncbi:MAG: IPExxxVDY family protein [Sediminibacterium sp.]|nr:IPExxxVDY family protein [Sediminibacterium sp.]
MAKHVLIAQEDIFDFALFGLRCSDNQYLMVNHLNQLLKIDLHLDDYLQLHLKEGRVFRFSLYRHLDEDLGLEYHVIPNRSNLLQSSAISNAISSYSLFDNQEIDERAHIIPELPQTDYFLLMKGEGLFQYETDLLKQLRTSEIIEDIKEIIPEELPSRRNLVL